MYKFFALLLSFSLLAPQALLADTPQNNSQPTTLAQYQQRAQEDVKKAPWISKEGKILIATLSIGGGALVLQHLYFQGKLKAQQKNFSSNMADATKQLKTLQTENAKLQQELLKTKTEALGFKLEAKGWENQVTLWQERYKSQKSFVQFFEDKAMQINFDKQILESEKLALQEELAFWKALEDNRFLPNKEVKEIAKKLAANQPLTTHEINLLTEGMEQGVKEKFLQRLQQPWFLSKTGTKAYIPFQENVMMTFMKYNANHVPARTAQFMKRIISNIKGFTGITLLLVLLTSSSNAQAQTQDYTKRLQSNINLFIYATPAELALLDKNEETRNLCIEISDLVHEMVNLPQEQQQEIIEGFQREPEEITRPKYEGLRKTATY